MLEIESPAFVKDRFACGSRSFRADSFFECGEEMLELLGAFGAAQNRSTLHRFVPTAQSSHTLATNTQGQHTTTDESPLTTGSVSLWLVV
jgi:hypothetical protein